MQSEPPARLCRLLCLLPGPCLTLPCAAFLLAIDRLPEQALKGLPKVVVTPASPLKAYENKEFWKDAGRAAAYVYLYDWLLGALTDATSTLSLHSEYAVKQIDSAPTAGNSANDVSSKEAVGPVWLPELLDSEVDLSMTWLYMYVYPSG